MSAVAGGRVRPVRRAFPIALAALIAAALCLPATSAAVKLHGLRFFHTADNNIACGMVKGVKKRKHKHPRLPGEARCDLMSHTWVAPPKPRYCDLDWGFGVAVGDKRAGNYVCAGDTVADQTAPVLAQGGSITLGRYTCSVPVLPATTVRCQNNLTMHGFEVSADTVSLF
jgi:uncharacterized protein DUF6636